MGELRVDGAADELAVDGLELSRLVAELADLSGADESEVKGPEEKHDIFAFSQCIIQLDIVKPRKSKSVLTSELFERNLLELVLPPSHGGELGGGLTDDSLLSLCSSLNHL